MSGRVDLANIAPARITDFANRLNVVKFSATEPRRTRLTMRMLLTAAKCSIVRDVYVLRCSSGTIEMYVLSDLVMRRPCSNLLIGDSEAIPSVASR